MGIFDRLGSVINSYFSDFSQETNRKFNSSGDPDLNSAFEELDDFLNNREPRAKTRNENSGGQSYSWRDSSNKDSFSGAGANAGAGAGAKPNQPPEELRSDFEKLEVPFGSDLETCKASYKKLLKIHHPDRHAGHEENFKKATERMARINASMDRIEKWHQK
ncbi:MAG: J domain-containing protein [Treponema sp.]|nr:J domain-containing protein [Treponema sp.]